MYNWDVKVVTESNYIKNVRVDNCITREDAEAAALGMSGAVRVINSNPVNYKDSEDKFTSNETVEHHHYHYQEQQQEDEEDIYSQLDEMEIEMYDLMCQIAMNKGEELPTIQEFYDYLNN